MMDDQASEISACVDRLRAGQPDARSELIELSYQRLLRLTRKMLKDFAVVKRFEETDDVFQQAGLRLWKSLEHVEPDSSRHFLNLAALQVRRELIELSRRYTGPRGMAGTKGSNKHRSPRCWACQLAPWAGGGKRPDGRSFVCSATCLSSGSCRWSRPRGTDVRRILVWSTDWLSHRPVERFLVNV